MTQLLLKIKRIHPDESALYRVREILFCLSQMPAMVDHFMGSMTHFDVGPVHPETEGLQGNHEFVMGRRLYLRL